MGIARRLTGINQEKGEKDVQGVNRLHQKARSKAEEGMKEILPREMNNSKGKEKMVMLRYI